MIADNPSEYFEALKQQIVAAPQGVDFSKLLEVLDFIENPIEEEIKIWFLLDRSGSMEHLTDDVVRCFNQFVDNQKSQFAKVRMTAIQFDSQDPFEVIYDAQPLEKISQLTSNTYSPRGMTPLYDALGFLIENADKRIAKRLENGESLEDQLVLVLTDGLENASSRYDRSRVFKMLRERTDNDWTFVFMGANQDSYAEGRKVGFSDGSIQRFATTPNSLSEVFGSASRATTDYRIKSRSRRLIDRENFFGDIKEAEEALRRLKGGR